MHPHKHTCRAAPAIICLLWPAQRTSSSRQYSSISLCWASCHGVANWCTHIFQKISSSPIIFPLVITCVYEYVCMHIEGCVIHIRGILAASTTVLHAVGIALASPTRHYHHLYQRQRCYLDRTASCCYCVALSAFGFVVAMAITDSYKSFIEWTPNYLSIYVSFKGSRL